jgi:hypothetical protein
MDHDSLIVTLEGIEPPRLLGLSRQFLAARTQRLARQPMAPQNLNPTRERQEEPHHYGSLTSTTIWNSCCCPGSVSGAGFRARRLVSTHLAHKTPWCC